MVPRRWKQVKKLYELSSLSKEQLTAFHLGGQRSEAYPCPKQASLHVLKSGMRSTIPSKLKELTPAVIALLRDAGGKLTGFARRAFMADTTEAMLGGSARRAENHLGWGRRTVTLALHEKRTGIRCVENFSARGEKKIEVSHPRLEADLRALLDPQSQADPQLRTTLSYTRMTAKAVRAALVAEKGWSEDEAPAERTLCDVLNRLGYRLRAVAKTRPEKKRNSPTPSSKTSERATPQPTPPRIVCD